MYKPVAKVLANRLDPFLPKLITDTQSGFMSERLITDNILIAHKSLHYLMTKRTGRMGYMALQLEIKKAYDWAEWVFLEKIMLKLDSIQDGSSLLWFASS